MCYASGSQKRAFDPLILPGLTESVVSHYVEEQQMRLTTGPSLQPLYCNIANTNIVFSKCHSAKSAVCTSVIRMICLSSFLHCHH